MSRLLKLKMLSHFLKMRIMRESRFIVTFYDVLNL